jgi:hypothetical protein
MSTPDHCTSCGRPLAWGRFEARFRLVDGRLRDLLDVPGCLCPACGTLFVDPRLLELAGLHEARCVMAIASERTAAVRVALGATA